MDEKEQEQLDDLILESVSKVVDPDFKKKKSKSKKDLTSLEFWCVPCTHKYTIHRKDKDGKLEKQSICMHMVFHEAVFD